jgi:hypothetical protein
MTWDRIVGAFTFRREVYSEVEHDTSFTTTAWLIVVIVAFLNQLGSFAKVDILGWLIGAVVGTIFAVIGFAVAAVIISWVGKAVFNAEVSFDEMVRTLGLAYVWNIVGVLGILGIVPALGCIIAPVVFIAAILGLVAWFIAAKEALDLEWLQTIVTVFLGWVALIIITALGGIILGIFGLGAAAIGGLF